MRSIAIEREFGSGGREVGRLVAEQLGMPFYDGEILFNTAERSGMDLGQLRNFDERQAGSLLFDLALAGNPNAYSMRTRLYEMFEAMQGTVRQLAQKEPSVFIGRCSTETLSGKEGAPRALRVFIYASDQVERCRRIMNTEHVDEQDARSLMRHRDKEREQYFRYFTRKSWGDKANYDIQLNTSVLPVQQCADILAGIVRDMP